MASVQRIGLIIPAQLATSVCSEGNSHDPMLIVFTGALGVDKNPVFGYQLNRYANAKVCLYPYRTVGRDRDNRDFGCDVVARACKSQTQSVADCLPL